MGCFAEIGDKIGMLTIIGRVPGRHHGYRNCKYACGSFVVKHTNTMKGVKPSCGCATKQLRTPLLTTHGMSGHPAYRLWIYWRNLYHMKKKDGSRHARITNEWLYNFLLFWEFVRPHYEAGFRARLKPGAIVISPNTIRFIKWKGNQGLK